MNIPAKISVPLCIEQGAIYHYKVDLINKDGTEYSGERFFIVLNVNPKNDEILVLTTITSQVEKQERFIKNVGEDPDTLVRISIKDFNRLSMDSIVNCNNLYQSTIEQLVKNIEENGKIFFEKLPQNIINALASGVLKSKQVAPEYKKLVI